MPEAYSIGVGLVVGVRGFADHGFHVGARSVGSDVKGEFGFAGKVGTGDSFVDIVISAGAVSLGNFLGGAGNIADFYFIYNSIKCVGATAVSSNF